MHYLNPFRVFDVPAYKIEAGLSNEEIQEIADTIRHKLSLYAEEEKIHFRTHKIKKAEVQRLLAEFENEEARCHHAALLKHKSLLNFLEYGHLGYFRDEHHQPSTDQPYPQDFIRFLAPYFTQQYSESFLQAIKTRDKETIVLLAESQTPFKDKDICYQPSAEYLGQRIRELEGLREVQTLSFMSEREILSHLPDSTIEIYNMLPDYFSPSRNKIATEVHGLAVVLNNDLGRGDGAEAMIRQALKLKMDEGIKGALEDLLDQHKIGFKMPLWLILGLGAIAALFLIQYAEQTWWGS